MRCYFIGVDMRVSACLLNGRFLILRWNALEEFARGDAVREQFSTPFVHLCSKNNQHKEI